MHPGLCEARFCGVFLPVGSSCPTAPFPGLPLACGQAVNLDLYRDLREGGKPPQSPVYTFISSSELHPGEAALFCCLNGCGCLSMRFRCRAPCCVYLHPKAKTRIASAFVWHCQQGPVPSGLGLWGGRTCSHETAGYHGAHSTFSGQPEWPSPATHSQDTFSSQ